jgi:ATP-binding cassette subfamily C protein
MSKAGAKAAESTIDANAAVGDLIAVFRELSVLGLRNMYIDRIYRSRVSAADSAATQTYLNGMPRYIVEAALLVGVAAFILVQALTGDIVSSAATIGVFLSGGFRLTAAMLPLQAALLSIKGYLPVASKAHEILLDRANEIESPKLTTKKKLALIGSRSIPLRVEFKKVSFAYSGGSGLAVSNLSLVIEPGQQVAFIGSSGAGKSTIADLMCGVLYASSGEISVKSQEPPLGAQLRECVSYVPQKPGLVSGSVAQNVALGLEPQDIDEGQVLKALAHAHLREEVLALPEGINTDLGKYQDGLSGGQIQRLGLARALYSEPGLLVMDEATSALDAKSEAEIAKALDQMRGKVTVVLIAHRLNTVQHADKVFLIEDGKLNDQGTFQELLRRNPSIDRLVQLMKIDEN